MEEASALEEVDGEEDNSLLKFKLKSLPVRKDNEEKKVNTNDMLY